MSRCSRHMRSSWIDMAIRARARHTAKLLTALRSSGDKQRAGADRAAAGRAGSAGRRSRRSVARTSEAYRSATGKTLTVAAPRRTAKSWPTASIPGPMRSFARMAAISADSAPEDILPALARNVVTNGYQASHSNEALEQTEYLKLVHRYLSQARELEKLAGEQKVITRRELRIRQRCRADAHPRLPHARRLRVGSRAGNGERRARLPDHGFRVPGERTGTGAAHEPARSPTTTTPPRSRCSSAPSTGWATPRKRNRRFHRDVHLRSRRSAACTWAVQAGPRDRRGDAKAIPFQRLKVFAHVLDFFGGMFEIRGGKAVVPGGQRSAAAWAELAGASPDKGAEFFDKLMSKDDGWLASLYDALARIHGPVQRLPDGSRAHEAFLHRGARPDHQSRSCPSGLPLQHRHDAADHAAAAGAERQAAHSRRAWKSGRTSSSTTRRASTTAS